jgi:DASH complex subunit DAD1
LEHVLQNINKLNRSLEGVIAVFAIESLRRLRRRWLCRQVGNEFGAVEALWSQFENVMAKEADIEEEAGSGKETW